MVAIGGCAYSLVYHFGDHNFYNNVFNLYVSSGQETNPRRRVFLFGIDGVGNLPMTMSVPTLTSLLSNGFYSWHVQSVSPTFSMECWSSILHGVVPEIHGRSTFIARNGEFPQNTDYPSIHKALSEKGLKTSSIANWKRIEGNILEHNISNCRKKTILDDEPYLNEFEIIVKDGTTSFVFMQFDLCDNVGHLRGYFGPEHKASLRQVDALIGKMVEMIKRLDGENYIIVTSDHGGGGEDPRSHGSDAPQDKTVFLICSGPGIVHHHARDTFSIVDIGPIVLQLLNVERPSGWQGMVPVELASMITKS